MNRRDFIKTSAIAGAGMSAGLSALGNVNTIVKNSFNASIPAWRGFNLLDFFSPDPLNPYKATTDLHLKWIRDWGFDFVRIPIAYPYYLNIDRTRPVTPDEVYMFDNRQVEKIELLVHQAHQVGLHTSINMHRAPGFCVNAGFHEPYNLWKDAEAMNAFAYHWQFWAKRFASVAVEKISFDLVNEPCMREDMNDQHAARTTIPGELYRKVAAMAVAGIRQINPSAYIVADGNNVGNDVTPELVDLNIAQSCRGYFPALISHYKAPWAMKDVDNLPTLKWPGKVGDQEFNRAMLEAYYKPWIELAKSGTGVHCGECGCWNKTPHAVFLSWFSDVLNIFSDNKIGFALWEFDGDFGVLNSSRTDVAYEDWYGQKLDRKLLKLLQHSGR